MEGYNIFMKKFQEYVIDGVVHVETKTVTYKSKEYKELKSAILDSPSVLYGEVIDGNFIPVNDRDTLYALRVMNAMCVLALHGYLIMDYTLNLYESEFIIDNGKLFILNDEKRKIFDEVVGDPSSERFEIYYGINDYIRSKQGVTNIDGQREIRSRQDVINNDWW